MPVFDYGLDGMINDANLKNAEDLNKARKELKDACTLIALAIQAFTNTAEAGIMPDSERIKRIKRITADAKKFYNGGMAALGEQDKPATGGATRAQTNVAELEPNYDPDTQPREPNPGKRSLADWVFGKPTN